MTKICPEDRIGVEMLNMFTRRVGIGTWKSLQFPAFWRTHCTPNDMDIRESWDTLSTPYRDKIRYSERARASDSSWNPGVSSVHRFYFHCRLFGEHSGLFSEHPKKWPSKKKARLSYVFKSPIQILIFLGQIRHIAQSPSFSWSNLSLFPNHTNLFPTCKPQLSHSIPMFFCKTQVVLLQFRSLP